MISKMAKVVALEEELDFSNEDIITKDSNISPLIPMKSIDSLKVFGSEQYGLVDTVIKTECDSSAQGDACDYSGHGESVFSGVIDHAHHRNGIEYRHHSSSNGYKQLSKRPSHGSCYLTFEAHRLEYCHRHLCAISTRFACMEKLAKGSGLLQSCHVLLSQLHPCHRCPVVLLTSDLLSLHMKKHDQELRQAASDIVEQQFRCLECDLSFANFNSLETHMTLHVGSTPVFAQQSGSCAAPAALTNTCVSGDRHTQQTETQVEMFGDLKTKAVVQLDFLNRSVSPSNESLLGLNSPLQQSEYVHNGVENELNGRSFKPYVCFLCTTQFDDANNFECHMAIHEMCETKGNKQRKKCENRKRLYLCYQCDQAFDKNALLQAHKAGHLPSEPYRCRRCEAVYTDKLEFEVHRTAAHPKQQFHCPVCAKHFRKRQHYEEHLRMHTGEKPYKCTICGCSFRQRSPYKLHMLKHSNVKPYKCSECTNAFRQGSELHLHMERRHPENQLVKDKIYKCSRCVGTYPFRYLLRSHYVKMHGPASASNAKNNSTTSEIEKDFSCALCDYRGHSSSMLKQHIDAHFYGKSFQCTDCGEDFDSKCDLIDHRRAIHHVKKFCCKQCVWTGDLKRELKQHLMEIHDLKVDINKEPFMCELCGAIFKHYRDLHHHQKKCSFNTDGAVELNSCPECGKLFRNKKMWERHVNNHRDVDRYLCTVCSCSFSRLGHFRRHMWHHVNKKECSEYVLNESKNFKCTQCNRLYSHKVAFDNHMRLHSGEKPHLCTHCNARFAQSRYLKRHVLAVHSGDQPYRCSVCGRGYKDAVNLRIHMRRHTGEKPYKCLNCFEAFVHLTALKHHQTTVHGTHTRYSCSDCHKTFFTMHHLQLHRMRYHDEKPS